MTTNGETGRAGQLAYQATDVAMLLAILDEATAGAYRAMRTLGLSIDAAKDAITVHISDTLIPLAQAEHELAGEHDEGGGVRAPGGTP